MSTKDRGPIAELVRSARARAKLTQPELAARAGISLAMLKGIETGQQAQRPSLETLMKLLDACGHKRVLLDVRKVADWLIK